VNPPLPPVARLLVRRGPDAVKWAAVVAPLLRDRANREQLQTLLHRVTEARRARTPGTRVAAEITALHDAAQSAIDDARDDAEREQAAVWLRRANTLNGSWRLIDSTQGAARRRGLEQLSSQVERLRDEILAANFGDAPPKA
jgi:hypothetical protein